jgi:DNA-binding response OmpR family regulator
VAVTDVLIASDSPALIRDLVSMLATPDLVVRSVRAGVEVLPAVNEATPDLVILDLQIGNMGGMAVCLDLRLEEGMDRIDHVPVLMLLDRRPDVFLARRANAEGWLVKPLDPIRLRLAVAALLEDGTYYDEAYRPEPVTVAAPSSTIADAGK